MTELGVSFMLTLAGYTQVMKSVRLNRACSMGASRSVRFVTVMLARLTTSSICWNSIGSTKVCAKCAVSELLSQVLQWVLGRGMYAALSCKLACSTAVVV